MKNKNLITVFYIISAVLAILCIIFFALKGTVPVESDKFLIYIYLFFGFAVASLIFLATAVFMDKMELRKFREDYPELYAQYYKDKKSKRDKKKRK